MGRKKPNTPRSRIRASIRKLWLTSRERAAVLKKSGYTCSECKIKQSRAKGKEVSLQVHHVDGLDFWDEVIDIIEEKILRSKQVPLCKECHDKEHEG